ncbi:hypothetical protein NUH86_15930 [Sphingobium sp. JS3065]|uniref:hypothetical protein n=1 Tax=Sphingobium sp. JS3065 TaxID=2970925 RepID=UPI00226433D4|nr:hypothetical protein [Sphingobium sp. JS3065]UZW54943.1 hypothetical protein NUH86_15930 [Sphingobium sp. JS3065]
MIMSDAPLYGATEHGAGSLFLVKVRWLFARWRYEKTLAAERTFHQRSWFPAYQNAKSTSGDLCPVTPFDDEMDRLADARYQAEGQLLNTPSPDLSAFAIKYLICFANGRDLNDQQEGLSGEAKRLLAENGYDPAALVLPQ